MSAPIKAIFAYKNILKNVMGYAKIKKVIYIIRNM